MGRLMILNLPDGEDIGKKLAIEMKAFSDSVEVKSLYDWNHNDLQTDCVTVVILSTRVCHELDIISIDAWKKLLVGTPNTLLLVYCKPEGENAFLALCQRLDIDEASLRTYNVEQDKTAWYTAEGQLKVLLSAHGKPGSVPQERCFTIRPSTIQQNTADVTIVLFEDYPQTRSMSAVISDGTRPEKTLHKCTKLRNGVWTLDTKDLKPGDFAVQLKMDDTDIGEATLTIQDELDAIVEPLSRTSTGDKGSPDVLDFLTKYECSLSMEIAKEHLSNRKSVRCDQNEAGGIPPEVSSTPKQKIPTENEAADSDEEVFAGITSPLARVAPEDFLRNTIPRRRASDLDRQVKPMSPLGEYLQDPTFANWVKSALALNITNKVLRPFVVNEITKLHQSIKETLPSGVSCPGCSVNTGCPNGICDKIQRKIEDEHWYPKPSFTNTCTGRWCTEPWEIAKCFMPPLKGCRNISASDADFTACISVIINCKQFKAFGTSDPRKTDTDFSKSRDFRNDSVMHAGPQKVSEHDMMENLNILLNILNMVKTPETEADTEEAIKKIEKIKTDQLILKLRDVIEVRKDAIEAIADNCEKEIEQVQMEKLLVNFEAGCKKALCRLTEEYINKQEENLSVADFLSKLRDFAWRRDLCPRHQHMLFPTSGTHADIREWDLFVYCFILEEVDCYVPLGNAASNFVKEVKQIRDKLLLFAGAVTQNDLSDLCEYLIDTDLNTEITEIFNKDSSDVNIIRSNNILVSWWRDEEDYGNKPVSQKQLNNDKRIMKKVDEKLEKVKDEILEKLGNRGEHATLQGASAVAIGVECELKPRGCDKKKEQEIQEDITSSNNNNNEKREAFDHFRDQRNLLKVEPVKGSIILNVKCSSITNVLDFWDSCIDGRAVAALSKVRDYYRRYYKCDTLEFDVILSKNGVSRCVNEIVESLPYHFKGLIDEVTHEVQEILKDKVESLPYHFIGPIDEVTHNVQEILKDKARGPQSGRVVSLGSSVISSVDSGMFGSSNGSLQKWRMEGPTSQRRRLPSNEAADSDKEVFAGTTSPLARVAPEDFLRNTIPRRRASDLDRQVKPRGPQSGRAVSLGSSERSSVDSGMFGSSNGSLQEWRMEGPTSQRRRLASDGIGRESLLLADKEIREWGKQGTFSQSMKITRREHMYDEIQTIIPQRRQHPYEVISDERAQLRPMRPVSSPYDVPWENTQLPEGEIPRRAEEDEPESTTL